MTTIETEIQTAARVAKLVFDLGLARVERPAYMVAFEHRFFVPSGAPRIRE